MWEVKDLSPHGPYDLGGGLSSQPFTSWWRQVRSMLQLLGVRGFTDRFLSLPSRELGPLFSLQVPSTSWGECHPD